MKADQSIKILKALADRSRLAIINSLLEKSQYVEEIAKRHDLAVSTVSFHLRKLEQAGLVSSRKEQYYVVFSANAELFSATLREIVSAHPVGKELQDDRMGMYRQKLLDTYFCQGRLEKLPAQHKKRLVVLEQFAALFEPGRHYNELEVTEKITPLFDDYCAIRRLLVDQGLIRREGATYWREADAGAKIVQLALPSQAAKESRHMPKETSRAIIKRVYKQNLPDIGIYQIRNTVNGRIYVGSSLNLEGARNSRLFQLRMGTVVFNRELQNDLNEYGAESFEFSILGILDQPEAGDSIERSLAALELHWLVKLQPFGDLGYNNIKAYQREMARMQNLRNAELA